jgi:pimeloyl-ACP methyl ester carboxylesterase
MTRSSRTDRLASRPNTCSPAGRGSPESRFGWNRNTLDRYQQAKVILLGFSGTGALVGRFPEYAPDHVLAAIASDPGHGDTFGVDTINLSTKAAAVPQTDSRRQRRRRVWNRTALRLLPQVLRPGCAVDLCRPERHATLLHHQRQGARARVAQRGRHSAGDPEHWIVRVHHHSGKQGDRMPSSKSTCQSHPTNSQRLWPGMPSRAESTASQAVRVPVVRRSFGERRKPRLPEARWQRVSAAIKDGGACSP